MPRSQEKKRAFKRLPKGPNGGVELLLIQSVDNLGRPGDIVEVKPGFANNYLIPQGLATVANEHHKRMIEKHRAKIRAQQEARLAGFREIADKINDESVTIESKANEEGVLYGSVGIAEIVGALRAKDLNVNNEHVLLDGQIKEHGLFPVVIRLHQDIENAELKVWVVPPAGEE
ncbi:MAG: 50S ribosomal protein L9 [Planctomycetaceae bacterium]|nr:50S ribosomal protein L9 [Planctomycetaceae bacterium]|tara:strand:+ start:222 stop:743 length:522 start_codon:yes stop_codon:yes gene_type:complete